MGITKVRGTPSLYVFHLLQGLDQDMRINLSQIKEEAIAFAVEDKVTWYEQWNKGIKDKTFAVIDGGKKDEVANTSKKS